MEVLSRTSAADSREDEKKHRCSLHDGNCLTGIVLGAARLDSAKASLLRLCRAKQDNAPNESSKVEAIVIRSLSTIGAVYLMACLGIAGRHLFAGSKAPSSSSIAVTTGHDASLSRLPRTAGSEWFERVRPSCNALEAETRIAADPPPESEDGTSWAAACLALAGKTDRARTLLRQVPQGARAKAASVVFEIGHSVADAGDERSAAPILALVLEFQPDNPMALYHLGMAEFGLYERDKARVHLQRFLEVYPVNDFSRQAAEQALPYTGTD